MSVSNIQADAQSLEQYKIRKQNETKQAEELQSQAQQPVQEIPKVDEYDKANPVGEEAEGIYSVSHDESGNLKINYVQPGSKSEASENRSAPTATSESENDSDSDTDAELEELKKQRDTLKLKLNSASDEETRAAIRVQLQAIEMQIAMKSTNTD